MKTYKEIRGGMGYTSRDGESAGSWHVIEGLGQLDCIATYGHLILGFFPCQLGDKIFAKFGNFWTRIDSRKDFWELCARALGRDVSEIQNKKESRGFQSGTSGNIRCWREEMSNKDYMEQYGFKAMGL